MAVIFFRNTICVPYSYQKINVKFYIFEHIHLLRSFHVQVFKVTKAVKNSLCSSVNMLTVCLHCICMLHLAINIVLCFLLINFFVSCIFVSIIRLEM